MSASPLSLERAAPRRVLVINAGSSSLKLSLHAGDGACDGQWQCPLPPGAPLEALADDWLAPLLRQLDPQPDLLVHRIVHGGEAFTAPTALSPTVLERLQELVPLAPLHNGPALRLIRWLQARFPNLEQQWACFDTAFHATLPPEASTYAIPAAWRQQGLRRYGFHGLNHEHVGRQVAAQAPAVRRLISCHLGAGCSLCAIAIDAHGQPRSVDTTMGFTPLEGLVMASRSGSVDPGLLLHLLRCGVDAADLDNALNRQSGLLGLSGRTADMRELRSAAAAGDAGAQLAIGVFRHRLLQGIGAMAASLGGVEAIALSGGIGEHDQALAAELREGLAWLGPLQWFTVAAAEEAQMVRLVLAALSPGASLPRPE